jgi:hypothetical protein
VVFWLLEPASSLVAHAKAALLRGKNAVQYRIHKEFIEKMGGGQQGLALL